MRYASILAALLICLGHLLSTCIPWYPVAATLVILARLGEKVALQEVQDTGSADYF